MRTFALSRRAILAAVVSIPVIAGHAAAHHGWSWTSDTPFELTGTIEDVYIGQPHARLTVRASDGQWQVDLAPLRSTTQAGFVDGVAAPGDEVTAYGYRSRDETERRMKAARVVVGGETYDVYPSRARAFD